MNKIFKSVNMYNQYIKYRLPSLKSELYLIKWLPESATIFHGHQGKQCDFMLLGGSHLIEKRRINGNPVETGQIIYPFKKYSINDTIGIHRIINNENKMKWSLHRYYYHCKI